MNPSNTTRFRRAKRGFALVVTLSLMILLTVIAVGLLTLSSISLRSASQGEAAAAARANARLALMMAIGELQKKLGPDSAITANSDLLAPAGAAAPQVLGAYPIDPSVADTTSPALYQKSLQQSAKTNVRWLVSSRNPLTDPTTQTIQSLNAETVPLVTAHDKAGASVKLLAGKIPSPKGAHAWRISDESQKATINVAPDPTLADGSARTAHSQFTPPASTHLATVDADESVEGNRATPVGGFSELTKLTASKLATLGQADIPYSVDGAKDWFRRHGSHLTAASKGLPVDVTHGRLKQDLSYYLETGKGLAESEPVIRGSSTDSKYRGPALPNLDYTTNDMPRFGLIRSWKDIGAKTTGFDEGGTNSQETTKSRHGIHPVILRAGLYFSPYMAPSAGNPEVPDVGTGNVTYIKTGSSAPITAQGKFIRVRHAFYPRITIWNPTTVPITDKWFLYQTACMLYATYAAGGTSDNTAAFTDNLNKGWGQMRDFSPSSQALIYLSDSVAKSAGIQTPYPAAGGPDGEGGALCFTYALRLDAPLLPGETRTFYPAIKDGPVMAGYTQSKFDGITLGNVGSGNIMVSQPLSSNYFTLHNNPNSTSPQQTAYYAINGRNMDLTRPPPLFVTARARYDYGRMKANTNNNLHGAAYRLFKVSAAGAPTLLQEFFDCDVQNGSNGMTTDQTPAISLNNTRFYDSPDDGENLPNGWALQKIYTDPNRDQANKRGHQIFLSYARESPTSVNQTKFTDGSAKFPLFAHCNPRARHVFPGAFEEQKLGTAAWTAPSQGTRQSIYSEGRPEAAWINDWASDDVAAGENGYGSGYGSPGLLGLDPLDGNQGYVYPLYDFPRKEDSVLSLGEFQSVNFATYPWQPGYAFGNARADARIPRELTSNPIPTALDHPYITKDINPGPNRYIDLSWLLNHSTWDRFFLSTIPYSKAGTKLEEGAALPNPRHLTALVRGGLDTGKDSAFDEAAAHILVDGAFNVNSTSVPAWKQFLLSNMNRTVAVRNQSIGDDSSPKNEAVFPRILHPYAAGQAKKTREIGTPQGDKSAFTANRSINDDEAHILAKRIVNEVRLRGPFTSLADFVNRRLVADSNNLYGEWAGLSGTLQTALDRATLEDKVINDHLHADDDLTFADSDVPAYLFRDHVTGRPAGLKQSRLAGSPGELTQGDILRTLGPLLTVRGDTFTIRAYGESVDKKGTPTARAWCEATVQRIAETVDPADNLVAPDTSRYPFGRRILITHFRWLSQDEI